MHSRNFLTFLVAYMPLSVPFVAADQIEYLQSINNANHIFNAIHSSVRQWGSSLNHNGMSFFMATVPAGTQLYHGTWNLERVVGMEWLAFEPEHALIFARPKSWWHPPPEDGHRHERIPKSHDGWHSRKAGENNDIEELEERHGRNIWRGRDDYPDTHLPWEYEYEAYFGDDRPPPPPQHYERRPPFSGHPHGPPPPGCFNEPPLDHRRGSLPPPDHPRQRFTSHPGPSQGPPHFGNGHESPNYHNPPPILHNDQHPLHTTDDEEEKLGYLHTYIPHHPLHLLYIDGLSAGKTTNGTLDTQDILLNLTSNSTHSPIFGDLARATTLCNLTSTLWESKIDGVLRMEGGFEIILCDFEAQLEVKDIMPVEMPTSLNEGIMGGWEYYKAITGRYHGIGGGRVALDYEDFVTVYAYLGAELWDNDVQSDVPMPRLSNARRQDLVRIREEVTGMVLRSERSGKEGRETVNWQEVADMLVTRYSSALHYLSTPISQVRKSKEEMALYLSTLLRPFINHTARNTTRETARCMAQVLPPTYAPQASSLAYDVISHISSMVCSTLLSALDVTSQSLSRSPTSTPPAHALALIDALVSYLQWTTWKECPTCADEEICIIPIWPMGTLEDHASPKCRSKDEVGWRGGYWGRGRPHHPPDKGKEAAKEVGCVDKGRGGL